MNIARVCLLSPPFSVLSYSLPGYLPEEAWQKGMRAAVPLGRGLRAGVILGFEAPASPEGPGAPAAPGAGAPARTFTLKSLIWPLEKTPLLSEEYLELATQMALRHTSTPGRILGAVLPAGLRTVKARLRFFGEGKPREMTPSSLASLPENELALLGRLWAEGGAEVCRAGQSPLDAEECRLAVDPPWPVRPAAKAQIALLEYLFEQGAVTRRKLAEDLGEGAARTLALLSGRGLVTVRPVDESLACDTLPAFSGEKPRPSPEEDMPFPFAGLPAEQPSRPGVKNGLPFILTPQQRSVMEPLLAAARSGRAETHLLFGITGSGKTAVYLELARDVLARGRSVLLLAPEVALALKLRDEAARALPGVRRYLYHGYQSPAAREAAFRDLASSPFPRSSSHVPPAPVLVTGTRSALFLPLSDIGLIVLDEEHDSSFKQDEGFVYQAKEVAWYRAGREKALLLLGSATPDVKSYYASVRGAVPLHVLTERTGGGELPDVRLVRMLPGGAQAHLLAEESVEALRRVVERGEQAVILLNRRGYAPQMYCLGCNAAAKCPHCDIGLAYHKGRERLLCHYCGYAVPFPSPCAGCGGMHFLPMGEGTERLEEHLASVLPPGTGVLRLDRDSTRRPGRMEEILRAFARKEAQVLVGTQMLSKGHHFPDVTLAVVADADLGLNLPDYRAAERTFQLLVQSAGRSGRGEKAGCVIIQTRNPAHYCWEFVRTADYAGFFERELALRQRRQYPPFTRLALIRISHATEDARGAESVAFVGGLLRAEGKNRGLTVLGPAPAPLPLLKGRRRYHCLIKGQDWQEMRSLFAAVRGAAEKCGLRIKLDLDPVNML